MASSAFPEPISGIKESLLDAAGDIVYASADNTPARLAIGSSAQVLTVSSGIPAWAAASAGALTLISTTSFSAVSSQQFNNVFSGTYQNYKVIAGIHTDTNAAELRLRYNVSGTDVTTGYRTALFQIGSSNTTQTLGGATTYITLGLMRGSTVCKNGYDMTIYDPNTAGQRRGLSFTAWNAYGNPGTDGAYIGAGDELNAGSAYTGFTLIGSGGTITGTVRIYGLAN